MNINIPENIIHNVNFIMLLDAHYIIYKLFILLLVGAMQYVVELPLKWLPY